MLDGELRCAQIVARPMIGGSDQGELEDGGEDI
jgi:hypothetical protein